MILREGSRGKSGSRALVLLELHDRRTAVSSSRPEAGEAAPLSCRHPKSRIINEALDELRRGSRVRFEVSAQLD
jgi:hypothetical protein